MEEVEDEGAESPANKARNNRVDRMKSVDLKIHNYTSLITQVCNL